jgi:type I restriction enzyme M protein
MDTKQIILSLGFLPEENTKDVFIKSYKNHQNYTIKIHHQKGEINYGNKITLGDKTTANFKANENFVVLECVNRLLEKGYPPQHITLEKDYPLGHKTKGKLDILVTDKEGKAYLMIECKTWESYDKAVKRTIDDGGQLFSYFQQDTDTQFLCLYTSSIHEKKILYKNDILKVEDNFRQASNAQEVFDLWNKAFKMNGIFEEGIEKYHITPKAYTLNDLEEITSEISKKIFHQFLVILRRHVISDKPNAFNKFIALFICKIVDEKKRKTEQLEFQWLDDDTPESLLIRLCDLYRNGMKSYLDKTITDYSDKDVDDEFNHADYSVRLNIKKWISKMRLEKNNEFAFKEVFDNQSFLENAKVVKDMVQMLEKYRVRYNRKHDYLGEFFEKLLNTSLKQESGQFFTPVPIARFIINSIPIKELVLQKINDKSDEDILPYAIDYACGSGHFITELMDQMQNIITEISTNDDFDDETNRKFKGWNLNQYDWAGKHIYGIEKDYRLFKTAKVACFLNGDGLANIINADGLAPFAPQDGYRDKLVISSKNNPKDNEQFEILVSNPPYSVESFRNTIEKTGAASFELYDRLTLQSSEIESLFIERSKQLLKEGGYAGIVLPSSILSNKGIYSDTRDIILKYFKIIAITEFGRNTFMETNTNTIVLFLQRRSNFDYPRAVTSVERFFQTQKDITANGLENIFSIYVAHVYKTLALPDYLSLINHKPNEKMRENEIYKDYQKDFLNSAHVKNLIKKPAFKAKSEADKQTEFDKQFYTSIIEKERVKLEFFILTYAQKTLLIKASPDGKNETEREFLGYEFNNHRGQEGIKPYGAKTIQEATKLFDENNLLNPEKANTHIYNTFLGKDINIPENLEKHITQQNLVDMINFDRIDFQRTISLATKKKVEIESKWEVVRLESLIELISGQSPLSEFYNTKKRGLPFYQGKIDFGEDVLKPPTNWTTQVTKKAIKNDILMSVRAPVGPVNINPYDEICIGRGLSALRPINDKCLHQYLYAYLKTNQDTISGNKGLGFDSISREQILGIKIPLPPKNIQDKIVNEIEALEKLEKGNNDKIEKLESQINSIIKALKGDKTTLKNVVEVNPSKSEIKKLSDDTPVSFIEMASLSNEGYITEVVLKKLEDVKTGFTYFKNEDVLFAKITPCMENGKGALVSGLTTEIGFGSTEFIVLRASNKISNKLLYHILKQKSFRQLAEKNMTGASGHRRVPKEFIENFEIQLPAPKDQQKIVSQIEKIETEITTLQNQLETIAEEKQAVLKKYL